jgi:hypothetical protein
VTLPTPLEAAAFSRYTTSAEIDGWLGSLAASSGGRATVAHLGRSAGGRNLTALLCGCARGQVAAPGKLRVLIAASLHGASEAAGGEALLAFARDLLLGARQHLLDRFEWVLIPNANPDGRDVDSARNAHRANLNRDFVLLGEPESRAIDAALRAFAPAVVLDAHESAVLKRRALGAAGYLSTFEAQFDTAMTPAIPAALRDFATGTLLPQLIRGTQAAGLPAQRYVREIHALDQPITHGDLTARTLRNKAGLRGALSLLLETPMAPKAGQYPSFRNVATRVAKQRLCLDVFVDCLATNARGIAAAQARAAAELDYPDCVLNARYVRQPPDATARLPLAERDSGRRVERDFPDHRTVVEHDRLRLPACYFVLEHMDTVGDWLARHGVMFETLSDPLDGMVEVDTYAAPQVTDADDADWRPFRSERASRPIPAGALRVPLSGRDRRLVALLLEPRSTSSVFRDAPFATLLRPGEPFFIARGR